MTSAADTLGPARRDTRVTALIGLAHGFSHFYQLVLPPLFPFLVKDFGVGYTELGLVMTVFYVTSGLMQTVAGFLVDHFGARKVLFVGISVYAGAIALFGLVPSIWAMVPLAIAAGMGNSVFHPADYSILGSSVSEKRMGRAFGLHTFGGNLGWAAAPPAMLFLADQFGWRVALIVAGLAGYVVLALLWRDREELRHESRRKARPDEKLTPAAVLAVFSSWPVVMCFTYFLLMSFSLIGVQNFLPPILGKLNGTPLAVGSTALTGFLLGSAAGVLAGGWLADRMTRHEIIVAGGILTAAPLLLWLGHADFAAVMLIAVTTIAGFAIGITTPSRDMLVRSAAPRGATGRVFGFVYSGLDAGSAIAPPIIGYLIDGGRPGLVFWLMSVSLLLAVFTAIGLRQAAHVRARA